MTKEHVSELDCNDPEVEPYLRMFTDFIESPLRLKVSGIAEAGWKVLVCESAAHFDEEYAEGMIRLCKKFNSSHFIAVWAEMPPQCVKVLRVEASTRGIDQFQRAGEGMFSYFMTPLCRSFCLFGTYEDYMIIAGSEAVLKLFAGNDVERLKREFQDLIKGFEERLLSPSMAEFLRTVLRAYSDLHV